VFARLAGIGANALATAKKARRVAKVFIVLISFNVHLKENEHALDGTNFIRLEDVIEVCKTKKVSFLTSDRTESSPLRLDQ